MYLIFNFYYLCVFLYVCCVSKRMCVRKRCQKRVSGSLEPAVVKPLDMGVGNQTWVRQRSSAAPVLLTPEPLQPFTQYFC